MKLGALLVVLGLIIVVLDLALAHISRHGAASALLHVGVIVIGVGILVGSTQLSEVP